MGDQPATPYAIRDAVPDDAPDLARVAIMAGHGLMDIFYEGLIPGQTPAQIIAERRVLRPGSFAALARWRVLTDGNRRLLGALNSFPHDLFEAAEPDPLLTPERTSILDNLMDLEASAKGSYYVNMIAVLPERRGAGAGLALMAEAERLARQGGFTRMSLVTFDADHTLLAFYRRCGFEIAGTRPIKPHPAIEHGGNWALMSRELA